MSWVAVKAWFRATAVVPSDSSTVPSVGKTVTLMVRAEAASKLSVVAEISIAVAALLPATVSEAAVIVGAVVSISSPVNVAIAPERSALVPLLSLTVAPFRLGVLVIARAVVFWLAATVYLK